MAAYDRIAEHQPLIDLANPDLDSGLCSGQDAAAQMAVDQINGSLDVLPDVWVDVLRINGDDPRGSITSSAAAAIAMHDLASDGKKHYLGVINFLNDNESRGAAQVASNNNILICNSGTEDAKFFANRLCPTCFAALANINKLGPSVVTYLQSKKVRRIAVLYQALTYAELRESFRSLLPRAGIQPIAFMPVHADCQISELDMIYKFLSAVDARYILLLLDPNCVADVYFNARNYGLVSPSQVWLSFNPPVPRALSISESFGPTAEDDLEGFVFIYFENQPRSTPAVRNFTDEYLRRSSLYLKADGDIPVFSVNAFDCVSLMLRSYDRLRRLRNASADDLAMDYTGVTQEKWVVDEDGFLRENTLFYNLNASNVYTCYDRNDAFGVVGYESGSPYEEIRPQIFFGGSHEPPSDGDLVYVSNELPSKTGMAIFAVSVTGLTASLLAFAMALRYRRDRVFVATSGDFAFAHAAGTALVFASGPLFALSLSRSSCHLRLWFQLTGFGLFAASIIAKNTRMYFLLKPKRGADRNWFFEMALFAAIVLLEEGLLICWSLWNDPRPVAYQTLKTVTTACISSHDGVFPGKPILYTYNALLLIAALCATRAVRWSEYRYSFSAIDNATTLAALVVVAAIALLTLPVVEAEAPSKPTAVAAFRFFAAAIAAAVALAAAFATKAAALVVKFRKLRGPLLPTPPSPPPLAALPTPSSLLKRSVTARWPGATAPSVPTASRSWPKPVPVAVVDLGPVCIRLLSRSPLDPWRLAAASFIPASSLLLFQTRSDSLAFRLHLGGSSGDPQRAETAAAPTCRHRSSHQLELSERGASPFVLRFQCTDPESERRLAGMIDEVLGGRRPEGGVSRGAV
ncbi:periplasmic binding protein-like I [Zopfochytrium polystomum]|nr:periplasmic binding protein-like I [Zopfochytrium polystomum]